MALENSDTVDLVSSPSAEDSRNYKLVLYIIDSVEHDDELRRYQLLIDKIRTYIAYVMGDSFRNEHPGVAPSEVLIKVLCISEPNEAMVMIDRVGPRSQENCRMDVHFCDYNEFMKSLQQKKK